MEKRKDSRSSAKKSYQINGDSLRAAVGWAVDSAIFGDLKFHGNTGWLVGDLVLLAVMWVWSDSPTLTGAFAEAHGWSTRVLQGAAVSTYQGFMGALATWTGHLMPILWSRLHSLMETHGGRHWRVGRWLPLAVDGSRISVPRTRANEQEFCAPNYGKSATAKQRRKKRLARGAYVKKKRKAPRCGQERTQPVKPQVWVTLLWHMGLHMPWSWKRGPSYAAEREHLREMITEQQFPKNTLFCADAGFIGYDLWTGIISGGHSFLIRVGANVTLLRKLGYVRERDGLVYCWPKQAAHKRQPPLVLRLLEFQLGKCHVHLVTNVIDESKLSDRQAIQLYKLRWGIELQFRSLKQTFGRHKLKSRRPDRVLAELDWSLLGLWIIQLFAMKEQVELGKPPDQCSVALAINVIRKTFQRWSEKVDKRENLRSGMQGATKDAYRRTKSKAARFRPDSKDKPAAGKPTIVLATQSHKQFLRKYLRSVA